MFSIRRKKSRKDFAPQSNGQFNILLLLTAPWSSPTSTVAILLSLATSSPFHNMPRSRNGCATCKRRHRKCDETKPSCQECKRNKLECGGYALKLQWDVGVASRGKLTGSSLPVSGSHTKARVQETLSVGDRSGLFGQFPVAPIGVESKSFDGDSPSDALPSPLEEEYSIRTEDQEPEWLQRRSNLEKQLFRQCMFLPRLQLSY